MLYCPNCGKPMPEGAVFCGECGTKITNPAQNAANGGTWNGQPVPAPGPGKTSAGNGGQRRKRQTGNNGNGGNGGKGGNNSWIVLLAILAALVIGLGAAAYFLLRDKSDKAVTGETAESSSQMPAIEQTTPAAGPSESGAQSAEGESLPQLPSLFGQNSAEAQPAEEAAPGAPVSGTESAPQDPAAAGTPGTAAPGATGAPAGTPGTPGTAAPGTPVSPGTGTALPGTATPVPTVQLTPIPTPAGHVDATAVHRYEVVIRDCTWNDAWNDAISRGGYLVRINSEEEFRAVCDVLNAQTQTNIHYYLGGSCDTATKQYHWMDTDGTYFDEVISDGSSWYGSHWYPGEPSFVDTELAAKGTTVEEYWMNLINVSGTWYFNDATYDLVGRYPDWLRGKVGYIVEYE